MDSLPLYPITPEDHFRSIYIRPGPDLPEPEALIPSYSLEPDAPDSGTGTEVNSGGDGSGGAGGDPATNAYIEQLFTLVNSLQNQIDGFNLICNLDGTLSWTFGDP